MPFFASSLGEYGVKNLAAHVQRQGGPKTGRLLARLISGRTPNIDLSAYSSPRYVRSGG